MRGGGAIRRPVCLFEYRCADSGVTPPGGVSPSWGRLQRTGSLRASSGFSLIELLLALVIFSIGALGAAGTLAWALRATTAGTHSAHAARLAVSALGAVTGPAAQGATCAALPAPILSGPSGEAAAVTLVPAAGGATLLTVLRYPAYVGIRTDTVWSFVRCR